MTARLICETSLVALVAAFAGPALAADLPARSSAPAPAPAFVAATWTGFYLGANAGIASNRFEVNKASLHKSSAALGIQGGFNYQITNIVVGFEADIAATPWMKKSNANASGRLSSLGTMRGRVGFTFDKTLVYATAGTGLVSARVTALNSGGASIEKNKIVAVGGVGIEHKLTSSVSVGIEGLLFAKPSEPSVINAKSSSAISFRTGNTGVVRGKLNFAF